MKRLLVAIPLLILLLFTSCISEPTRTFPPPEGYSSWEEYNQSPGVISNTPTRINDSALSVFKELIDKNKDYLELLISTPAWGRKTVIPNTPFNLENSHYIVYANGSIEIGGDNKPIELINNPSAINVTYEELLNFIIEDPTNLTIYQSSSYVCSDYAEDIHNNAEAAGIKAAWVGISFFDDTTDGHALNAFLTTDKGLIFIDCTEKDTVAYLKLNEDYCRIEIPLLGNDQEEGIYIYGVVKDIVIHWGN